MKPLPYRARRVDTNELVYGGAFEHKGKTYIIPAGIRILPLGYTLGPPSLDGFVEVHPDSVFQSTGRKDKHGVEIYGGMSLKSCNHKRVLLISWSDERCAFVVLDGFNENLLSHWNTAEFEIIEGD